MDAEKRRRPSQVLAVVLPSSTASDAATTDHHYHNNLASSLTASDRDLTNDVASAAGGESVVDNEGRSSNVFNRTPVPGRPRRARSAVYHTPPAASMLLPYTADGLDEADTTNLNSQCTSATRIVKQRPSLVTTRRASADSVDSSSNVVVGSRRSTVDITTATINPCVSVRPPGPSPLGSPLTSNTTHSERFVSTSLPPSLCSRRATDLSERADSFGHLLDSPQEPLATASIMTDYSVANEGVDWTRVDADPLELLRQGRLDGRHPTTTNAATASLSCPSQRVTTTVPALSPKDSKRIEEQTRREVAGKEGLDGPHAYAALFHGSGKPVHGLYEAQRNAIASEDAVPRESDTAQPKKENSTAITTKVSATAAPQPQPQQQQSLPSSSNSSDTNIFVAVRVRPSIARPSTVASVTSASRTATTAAMADLDSCMRADVRRGFIDCTTAVAAASAGANGTVGVSSINATATTAATTAGAAAGQSFEKPDQAPPGRRLRTLRFFFDHILNEHATQSAIMDRIGQQAVSRVLAGYHGTVLCYGQSGSGKTYTIVGPNGGTLTKEALRWRKPSSTSTGSGAGASRKTCGEAFPSSAAAAPEAAGTGTADAAAEAPPTPYSDEDVRFAPDVGLLPRMLLALFRGLEAQRRSCHREEHKQGKERDDTDAATSTWSVTFSALELYNEEPRDLLPHSLHPHTSRKSRRGKRELASTWTAGRRSGLAGTRRTTPDGGNANALAATTTTAPAGNMNSHSNTMSLSSTFAGFSNYPSHFNATGGIAKHTRGLQQLNKEDLEVLNAVSSSDDDDDDEDDEDEEEDAEGEGDANNTNSPPTQPLSDSDTLLRPTLNALPSSLDPNGRRTVGELTAVSLSPSPRASPATLGSESSPSLMAVAETPKQPTPAPTTPAACKQAMAPTRVQRQLPGLPAASAASSKSSTKKTYPRSRSANHLSDITGTTTVAAANYGTGGTSSFANRHAASVGAIPLTIRQRPPLSTVASTESTSANSGFSQRHTTGGTTLRSSRTGTLSRDGGDAAHVEGLKAHPIYNVHDAMRAVRQALKRRHMGSTELNNDSSRAHTFFFVRVEQRQVRRRRNRAAAGEGDSILGDDHRRPHGGTTSTALKRSTLTLVDLAGSERVSHTGAFGQRLKEAQNINLSLSSLGNVMRLLSAAAQKGSGADPYIPYRDSKLTRILQSSLGGNAITFLLCNVSPDPRDALETMSTLRFAKLSKSVKTNARLNAVTTTEDDDEGEGSKHEEWEREQIASRAATAAALKERQAALEAVAAAELQLRHLVSNSLDMRARMQQMASYAWWLEEQLKHFAAAAAATAASTDAAEGRRVSEDTLASSTTPPTSLTATAANLDGAASTITATTAGNSTLVHAGCVSRALTTPPAGAADGVDGRHSSSSVGPLSDPDRTALELRSVEKAAAAELSDPNSNSWHASWAFHSIATPPPQHTALSSSRVGVAPTTHKHQQQQQQQHVHDNPMNDFMSPTYSLTERQRNLQHRLIAAAASVSASFPSTVASVTTSTSDLKEPEKRANLGAAVLGGTAASVQGGSPSPLSPAIGPATVPMALYRAFEDTYAAAVPLVTNRCNSNVNVHNDAEDEIKEEGDRLGAPLLGSSHHRSTLSSTSGVIVSESSIPDPLSPRSSAASRTEANVSSRVRQRPSRHVLSTMQVARLPQVLPADATAQTDTPQYAQPQDATLAVLLAAVEKERLAREAAEARLADMEKQNVLLRLRLAAPVPPPARGIAESEGHAIATRTAETPPASDHLSGLLTPSLPTFPHASQISGPRDSTHAVTTAAAAATAVASLEMFLARCGFAPLDPEGATAAAVQRLRALTTHVSSLPDSSPRRRMRKDGAEGERQLDDAEASGDGASSTDSMTNASLVDVGTATPATTATTATTTTTAASSRSLSTSAAVREGRPRRRRGDPLTSTSPPQSSGTSPGWKEQLLTTVRTTLDTVRSLSTNETFFDAEDAKPVLD